MAYNPIFQDGSVSTGILSIYDFADDTKKIIFNATSIASGFSRTIIMPDFNVNLGDIYAHASRHLPSGADALTTAIAIDIAVANAVGVANSFARSDHAHQGLHSIKANAGPQRYGDVSLVNGTAITITDDGFGNFTFSSGAGGTVTSVAMTVPSFLSVAGSPITTSGTFAVTLATQANNVVFAGPNGGGPLTPTFRSLVSADIPALAYVTSVALSLPSFITVSGSPVTSSGTLTGTLATQAANLVFAGPTTGGAVAPTFRSLVVADIPTGVPSTQNATNTNTEGTSAFLARADHLHTISTGVPSAQTPDQANATGTSANLARADHIHQLVTATAVSISLNANAQGVATNFARSDHTHRLTSVAATTGQIPQFDGTNWIAKSFENIPDFTTAYFFYDEFMSQPIDGASITASGSLQWTTNVNGGGSAVASSTTVVSSNHPGVLLFTAGAGVGRAAGIGLGSPPGQIIVGGGALVFDFIVNIPTLATVGVDYNIRIGLGNTTGATDFTNGIYFEYERATSVNWLIKTANGGTRTTTTTGTAVATGWAHLRAEVNTAATSIEYFINDVSVGTIVTNIPTLAMGYVANITSKTTNASLLYIDYFFTKQRLTTTR